MKHAPNAATPTVKRAQEKAKKIFAFGILCDSLKEEGDKNRVNFSNALAVYGD